MWLKPILDGICLTDEDKHAHRAINAHYLPNLQIMMLWYLHLYRAWQSQQTEHCVTCCMSAVLMCNSMSAVVPCNTGLACLPLQAGGTAGSGVGYCTRLGLGQSGQDGAAAIRVSVRKTVAGTSCRLPIVYK